MSLRVTACRSVCKGSNCSVAPNCATNLNGCVAVRCRVSQCVAVCRSVCIGSNSSVAKNCAADQNACVTVSCSVLQCLQR